MYTIAQLQKAATLYDEGHADRMLIEEAITNGMEGYLIKLGSILRPLEPRLRESQPIVRRHTIR